MSKCIHHNQITQFCIKANCQYENAGGCQKCFIQDHSHATKPQRISLGDLEQIMKRYLFPKKVKPYCKNIQESFYNYFKSLKDMMKNIQNQIDQLCKNVVNNIGFPYLSQEGYFKIYKRIKNHDLSKITPKQLLDFINSTKNLSSIKMTNQQEKRYLTQVQKYFQLVQQVDYSISFIEHLFGQEDSSAFQYDQKNIQGIEEFVAKIEKETGETLRQENLLLEQKIKKNISTLSKHSDHIESLRPEPLNFQRFHSSPDKSQLSQQQQSKGHNSFKISPQKTQENKAITGNKQFTMNLSKVEEAKKETKQSPQPRRRRDRRNSIDNQLLFKQNNLEKKIAELKKKGSALKEESEMTQSHSSKNIINFDLPQAEQEKIEDNKDFEIVPITRKLEETPVIPSDLGQCASPLLRKKKQYEQQKCLRESIKKESSQTENLKGDSPYYVNTPHHNGPHGNKTRGTEAKLIKKSEFPELTEKQEISYMLLIKALSYEANDAIKLLERALEQSETNLSAVEYLSFLYLESNMYKKCIQLCNKYLRKLLTTKKQDVQETIILLLCNKSGSLNCLGRYSETITLLNSYEGENQVILKNLANAYLSLGKYDEAIPLFKKALQDCHDDDISYNLSVCWYMKEDYLAAKFTLQSALMSQNKKQEYVQLQKHIIEKITKPTVKTRKYSTSKKN